MPPFAVNVHRHDPYKNFKFRVVWDGTPVAGVAKVSGLKRVTEVVSHREGGEPNAVHKSPGISSFEPITLERGLTHDTAFEDWASLVWLLGAPFGAEASLKSFRKDILIQLCNEAGQVVLGWKVYRCWVSEYQALPDLDSNANAVAIERIVLQNEGWERDEDIPEPAET
jgi:phage tail-like protein